MEARKENKVYTIDTHQKDAYLKQGYDIYEDGKIIEYTPLKTIKYSDHIKVVEDLKKNTKQVDNVFELLKNYAEEKNIDVGQTTSANGILNKILEVEKIVTE